MSTKLLRDLKAVCAGFFSCALVPISLLPLYAAKIVRPHHAPTTTLTTTTRPIAIVTANDAFAERSETSKMSDRVDDENAPAALPTAAPPVLRATTAAAAIATASTTQQDAVLAFAVARTALSERSNTLPICHRDGGPEGPGIAQVTFLGEGNARVALAAPYANTEVGACVARRFAGAARAVDVSPSTPPFTIEIRFAL